MFGGGQCGRGNFQTLCVACHSQKTKSDMRERKKRTEERKKAEKAKEKAAREQRRKQNSTIKVDHLSFPQVVQHAKNYSIKGVQQEQPHSQKSVSQSVSVVGNPSSGNKAKAAEKVEATMMRPPLRFPRSRSSSALGGRAGPRRCEEQDRQVQEGQLKTGMSSTSNNYRRKDATSNKNSNEDDGVSNGDDGDCHNHDDEVAANTASRSSTTADSLLPVVVNLHARVPPARTSAVLAEGDVIILTDSDEET
ncbi:unnamed protein product [Amoebophrya sp. A25]|nr:unnamed protein product [Amoebophrya sp. A25]|eukprot:GSA25T00019487001.1